MERVLRSVEAIKRTNDDFGDIIETASIMGEKTDSITKASENHAEGMDTVTRSVHEIEQSTQQVASGAEQVSAASEELTRMTREVKEVVRDIIRLVKGDSR